MAPEPPRVVVPASSDSHATGTCTRRTQSASRTVLPYPAGAQTSNSPRPSPSSSRSVSRGAAPGRAAARARAAWWPAAHPAPRTPPTGPERVLNLTNHDSTLPAIPGGEPRGTRWRRMPLSCPAAAEDSTRLVHFVATPAGRPLVTFSHSPPSTDGVNVGSGTSSGEEAAHETDPQGQAPSRIGSGRHEPLAAGPRDPDIVYAHRIARRSSRPGTGRVRPGSHHPAAPVPGR